MMLTCLFSSGCASVPASNITLRFYDNPHFFLFTLQINLVNLFISLLTAAAAAAAHAAVSESGQLKISNTRRNHRRTVSACLLHSVKLISAVCVLLLCVFAPSLIGTQLLSQCCSLSLFPLYTLCPSLTPSHPPLSLCEFPPSTSSMHSSLCFLCC